MRLSKLEEARIRKVDGRELGPYSATFSGRVIIIHDPTADIEEGDTILRLLPSGKDECSTVTNVSFYRQGPTGLGDHYQVEFRKGKAEAVQRPSHNITIAGAQSVQIGDYNTQNITNSLEAMVKIIDSSEAPIAEKEEAKSLLARFLAHPLVVASVGAGVGAAVGAVLKP